MKRLIMVVLLWATLAGGVCFGQHVVEHTLPWHRDQPVVLNLKFGDDVNIRGWDKDRVYIKATIRINDDRLDSLFTMKVSSGNNLEISTDIQHTDLRIPYLNGCDDNHRMITINNHTILCAEIHYEVFVPVLAKLELSSINANEIIRNMKGPVKAKSISGFVDMDWPHNRGANLELKSITGEAYSNFNDVDWRNRKSGIADVGYLLKGMLHRGGPLLHLESISNNVYLRKTR